jgi:hypothetical protein
MVYLFGADGNSPFFLGVPLRNASIIVALVMFSVGCGSSPRDVCKRTTKSLCNKIYTCFTGLELDAAKLLYGPTEADCVTRFDAMSSCDRSDFDTKPCGNSTQTYNAVKANECLTALEGRSCNEVRTPTAAPAACSEVCK